MNENDDNEITLDENTALLRDVESGKLNVKYLLEKKESDFNNYATSKSVSQEFLNTSSIQAQIAMLVGLFASRTHSETPLNGFEIALIVLIGVSLLLQFVIFVLLVVLAKSTTEKVSRNCTATNINNTVTSLSGLGLIVNLIISVVSIQTLKSSLNTSGGGINTTTTQ